MNAPNPPAPLRPLSADDELTVIRPIAATPPAPARPPAPAHLIETDSGALPVGTRLHEFEIIRLIGEGGFGLVYEAQDHALQRRVALKEYMPGALATRRGAQTVTVKSERHRETFEAGLKSFVNEARLLASFDHPALIRVYRFWEDRGTAYMVMPLLKGVTLKDHLGEIGRRPDEAWLRGWLGPVSEALAVIHAQNCYHRDIAPDNIMLLPETQRWLLLDFGAARRVIGDMTQALTVILKPGYAPVEQYAEIPGMKQGAWTDVYALAASVYYAITGRTPPPSVGRMLKDSYVPLAEQEAGIYSPAFLTTIDRALAVRPEDRVQSIAEFRAALGMEGEADWPTALRPPPPAASHSLAGAARPGPPSHATTDAAPARPKVPASHEAATTLLDPQPVAARPGPAQGVASGSTRPPAQPTAPAGARARDPAALASGGKARAAWQPVAAGGLVLMLAGLAYVWLTPARRPPPAATLPVAVGASAVAPAPVDPGVASATVPSTQAALPASTTSPAPQATAPAGRGVDVGQEFDKVVAGASTSQGVSLRVDHPRLRVNQDELAFEVRSERGGYLYVLTFLGDSAVQQVVPNPLGGAVQLKPGQSYRFPAQDGFVLNAPDKPGTGRLLAFVSPRQRDFTALATRKPELLLTIPLGGEGAQALAAHQAGPDAQRPWLTGRPICSAASPCDDSYGAAQARLEAIQP